MAEGIKANLTQLQRRGVTAEHAATGAELAARLERLDQEQEALKSQLQAKTAEVKAGQVALQGWYARYDNLTQRMIGCGSTTGMYRNRFVPFARHCS
jgi:hypothetical protein